MSGSQGSRLGIIVNRLKTGAVGILFLLLGQFAPAQTPVEFYQTWNGTNVQGWAGVEGVVSVNNPGGYLNIGFGAQSLPFVESDIVRTNLAGTVSPTNIAFAIKPFLLQPSAVRVYFHSAAQGRLWYRPLDPPPTGQWTVVDVPVQFSEQWNCDPGIGRTEFQNDVFSVDWIGVYVRRHGNVDSQNYGIDDFLIQGVVPPSSLSISGEVAYDGEQAGTIRVSAAALATTAVATLSVPGNYAMPNLPLGQIFTITAYRDSNGNSTQEFWEAQGAYAGNPVELFMDGLSDADLALADPASAEGIPYWWLNQYFGISEPGGGGGEYGETDTDADHASDFAEYRAGTDPTNALSYFAVDISYTNQAALGTRLAWSSIADRSYGVWRATSIAGGFTKIEGGITATPPENVYDDATATGRGPYFYRIEIEP